MNFLFVVLIAAFIIIVYSIIEKYSDKNESFYFIKEYNDIDIINMLKLYDINIPINSKFGLDEPTDTDIEYNISTYVKPWLNSQPAEIKEEIFNTIFQIYKTIESGSDATYLTFDRWILFNLNGPILCRACLTVFDKYKLQTEYKEQKNVS